MCWRAGRDGTSRTSLSKPRASARTASSNGQSVGYRQAGLAAHGRGQVVLPPKGHIHLDDRYHGHFNILMGWAAPIDLAGVKVIGDYLDNYRYGLPSEIAMLTLYDPRTGVPAAIMDATDLTTQRTGAVTGIGAKHLAPPSPRVVGHIGARGTAFANLAALSELFEIDEIRISSKRGETREALAQKVRDRLGVRARSVATIEEAVRGADIVTTITADKQLATIITPQMVEPGMHFNGVGGDCPARPSCMPTCCALRACSSSTSRRRASKATCSRCRRTLPSPSCGACSRARPRAAQARRR
ncbi:MAG: ornithine cyclodeaminase family protein [Rhodospirillales bacterium]|nr:ornithine cyclodeaminase family protein [Rhodospirillales bacterium]